MKTILILGATGKVGQKLLELALAHPDISHVVAPTRRPLASPGRLSNPIVDYRSLQPESWWHADACVCALGTTLRQAGSREAFVEVDHDHVLAAARLARQAGTPTFVFNSSLGANARASNFYLRVKGQTEDDLTAIGFDSLIVLRPSLLEAGKRADSRPAEALSLLLLKGLRWLVPIRYRAVSTEAVASRMLDSALHPERGRHIIESENL